jgi:hypothetical protein
MPRLAQSSEPVLRVRSRFSARQPGRYRQQTRNPITAAGWAEYETYNRGEGRRTRAERGAAANVEATRFAIAGFACVVAGLGSHCTAKPSDPIQTLRSEIQE